MTRPNSLHAEMYKRMLLIRYFEETAVSLLTKGDIAGALHTTPGQEASIVGSCLALGDDDYMVGTHRSHGHPIGKGARLTGLMAELMGRMDGVNQGKGGSMHLADFSVGSLGETSIVGSGLPVATGAALGAKMMRTGRVSLCFFGDGASSEGTFHESLNLAAIWKLPVIYLCENNLYAITTSAKDALSVADIASRAAGYAMPGKIVDGQDVIAVHQAVSEAVERARRGDGPSLIECKTYRYNDHAAGLPPVNYRAEAEIAQWRERDPITLFRSRLLTENWMDEASIQAMEDSARDEVAQAVDFARQSPLPTLDDAFDHVFADPIRPIAR